MATGCSAVNQAWPDGRSLSIATPTATIGAGEPTAVTGASGNYTLSNVPSVEPRARSPAGRLAGDRAGHRHAACRCAQRHATFRASISVTSSAPTARSTESSSPITTSNDVRDPGERGLSGNPRVPRYQRRQHPSMPANPALPRSPTCSTHRRSTKRAHIIFTHLAADTYHMREISTDRQSATPLGSREQTFLLLPGEDRTVNFGDIFRNNEIHGKKFEDLNGNHQLDTGEPGIGGVTIYIDADRDNVMDPLEAAPRPLPTEAIHSRRI